MTTRRPQRRRPVRPPEAMSRRNSRRAVRAAALLLAVPTAGGWSAPVFGARRTAAGGYSSRRYIYPPPGSGYLGPEDEEDFMPATYEPMMQYPGTMRPGMTPENIPYQDLPLGDADPDPVPWPHLQQIEWHHRWESPPDYLPEMEDFIEMQGLWATPEFEASMRAGTKRSLQKRQEHMEAEKRQTIITDDADDTAFDDGSNEDGVPVGLEGGMFGQSGNTAKAARDQRSEVPEEDPNKGLDDFLLDLGLDLDLDEDPNDASSRKDRSVRKGSQGASGVSTLAIDDIEEEDDAGDEIDIETQSAAAVTVDDETETALGLDEDDDNDADDDVDGSRNESEDFGDSDALDNEDLFGDGGFDFDGGDFEAADGFDVDEW